jgi:hypothetical protein
MMSYVPDLEAPLWASVALEVLEVDFTALLA